MEKEPPIIDNSKEGFGHRAQHRMAELTEDAFDTIDEVIETETGDKEDSKGVDVKIRMASRLLAPDYTTAGPQKVKEKIDSMARNPFTVAVNENGERETALRFVIHGLEDNWRDFVEQADKTGRRVAESQPHNVVVSQKKKWIEQMQFQIKYFRPYCKGKKDKEEFLDDIEAALKIEWLD
ncbi:MAG: hypothetical protein NT026_00340 [Candidatus Staskawiczbacteria bacterium]|nr:hypothetical protein [Candidatus Staskawiczbacteria bacterium]